MLGKRKLVAHDGISKRYHVYDESFFKARMAQAFEEVKKILDNTRTPEFPSDVQHEYEDKYLLIEFLSITSLSAIINSLEWLGVSGVPFKELKEWSKTKNVTLRFRAEEECKFVRKDTREVKSDTKHVVGDKEHYIVTTVHEYFWNFSVKWEILVFSGVDSSKSITFMSHVGSIELKTSVDSTPRPVSTIKPPTDLNITYLLQNVDESRTPTFAVDRKSQHCRTPRRNGQVEPALTFLGGLHSWCKTIREYFLNNVFADHHAKRGYDLSLVNGSSVFNPVLPLFDSSPFSSSTSNSNSVGKIPPVFFSSFLSEQIRSYEEKKKEIVKTFPEQVTQLIAQLLVTLSHMNRVAEAYSEGVDYVENLLQQQLVAAIGKIITPTDFDDYLTFHNHKIYREAYRPKAFSYAIRRPDHYPEGVLSIESQPISNPISTLVKHAVGGEAMHFAINDAANISFFGDRYLHAYVSHQFGQDSGPQLSLCARARQFSSFILLVGRILSENEFEPKYATIIQNKDEFKIPLLLETIPTPKDFKDAISSLSPEQRRFCKAFRSMQLESTLFGVCVIQIKPQLEKLLNIPDDSLTKEIQLTQDLLNLFIKYQIPSDLVSYDGEENTSVGAKINSVKEYVKRMHDMVEGEKKEELQQARMEAGYREQMQLQRLQQQQQQQQQLQQQQVQQQQVQQQHAHIQQAQHQQLYQRLLHQPVQMQASQQSSFQPMLQQIQQQQQAQPQSHMAQIVTTQQIPIQENKHESKQSANVVASGIVDYTTIPSELERKFDELDESNALRATIINPGKTWSKKSQPSLLSEPQTSILGPEEQKQERNKAFDLLDALTKSGVLPIHYASLHVIIASTHSFDKSIIQTVVQDNINPIEKVENSSMIIASTIHKVAPEDLIEPAHLESIKTTSSLLLAPRNSADGMDI